MRREDRLRSSRPAALPNPRAPFLCLVAARPQEKCRRASNDAAAIHNLVRSFASAPDQSSTARQRRPLMVHGRRSLPHLGTLIGKGPPFTRGGPFFSSEHLARLPAMAEHSHDCAGSGRRARLGGAPRLKAPAGKL